MKKILILLLAISSSCFAVEIKLSETDEAKADRREKAFEDWIPMAENQVQFDQLVDEENKFPIFSIREYPKIRSIFIDRPKGANFWTFASMTENELLEKEKKHTNEGYVLIALTSHKNQSDEIRYWATWVNQSREREVMRELRRLGITQAEIETD
ncbi:MULTISPECIES: hypothetical protein [unclassified Lentimonas]|uniref:hypothetical protein n=1 Tax=unclassified Lentimonas TaxID=2630993 RepID=UPI00132B7081|nr:MULTISPECIES: hypothetical protein [unclassified Lentimonas]CAA6696606.1 Unannotated [Lentimonas sp. CC10]CAA6697075.1 Unannotated [Lentimonas sp. CC19]CAA7069110.1 Unannotated [Lentimonas sp. CC11]